MCLKIGPVKCAAPEPMIICNDSIQWADKVKYLGITLTSGKSFNVDFADTRRKFFLSVNTILNKCSYTSDIVKLEMLESYCLPIILYAMESLNVKGPQLKEVNAWWNAVYRKIFGYHKWESVKGLICELGRLDIMHIVNLRRLLFIKRT